MFVSFIYEHEWQSINYLEIPQMTKLLRTMFIQPSCKNLKHDISVQHSNQVSKVGWKGLNLSSAVIVVKDDERQFDEFVVFGLSVGPLHFGILLFDFDHFSS